MREVTLVPTEQIRKRRNALFGSERITPSSCEGKRKKRKRLVCVWLPRPIRRGQWSVARLRSSCIDCAVSIFWQQLPSLTFQEYVWVLIFIVRAHRCSGLSPSLAWCHLTSVMHPTSIRLKCVYPTTEQRERIKWMSLTFCHPRIREAHKSDTWNTRRS